MSTLPGARSTPWYREPWPWLLMAGPAVVIVAGVITACLAIISNDGLVEDDYYRQGLAINQITARDQRASDLGLKAELVSGGQGERIRAHLRSAPGAPEADSLVLLLTHPTRSGLDQKVILRPDGASLYAGSLTPVHGRWHVVLEDGRGVWRLTGDWLPDTQPVLRLTPSAGRATSARADSERK
ncbi:FixH family protein [Accumulibacter sp.]|uniref:FixH family protein n=1 Tax=Accumulibacter sp. TaxID=2053492 RepID=UPI0025E9F3C9|nr:FixH family protein [Accumulibacter sp.]MCM8596629.1 FixH family protein [Accumulibacter sp.]MCM8627548.1 FixH family protein [Accumulibacter sp.]MDS4050777.1 FixH family protein [Accumulibacter sp.]